MELSDEALTALIESGEPTVQALAAELQRLRRGIRDHRSKTGHQLCWLNDRELWALVDPVAEFPHGSLPVREEFLAQCARYYQSRLTGSDYEEPEPRETLASRRLDGGK
jgi:hypothetical protein